MHPHLQYQDLLGSGGPGYLQDAMDDHDSLPTYWHNPSDMSYIDPQLRPPPYESHASIHHHTAHEVRTSFTSYDLAAHGFSPRSSRIEAESVLPQFGFFDPGRHDNDQFRHLRHFSPTDPSGFALSSNTDSSVSDYALSPDMARASQDLPLPRYTSQGFYDDALGMTPVPASAWSPHPTYAPVLPSVPVLASHTIPSMRHLQVTPDPEPEHEDEPAVDRSAFQPSISHPEELEISEQIITPPDSGADRSFDDDDTMKDDEDEDSGAIESDNDSEFSPRAKPARRRSSVTVAVKRHSLRETRRPKSVIDPRARVTKPSSHDSGNTPRAKSKKKPPVTKKSNSDSKNFSCAFHHYGCCATFANKNEWKRHVSSQHLQLGFYRCDMDSCADHLKGYNDFNRKDLFTQHCRRMHAPWSGTLVGNPKKNADGVSKKDKDAFEKKLDGIRARCWVDRRKAPASTKCGFCGRKFTNDEKDKTTESRSSASSSWEERMEHVGRHFERDGLRLEDEQEDLGLRKWALQEGLVIEKKGKFWLVGFEPVVGGRKGGGGERRSRRLVEEEDGDEDDNVKKDENDEEEANTDESVRVAKRENRVKMDDSSDDDNDDGDQQHDIDADAESESDIDAEAEDDDEI